jgi:DNA-binding transcriptional LysR family regulator
MAADLHLGDLAAFVAVARSGGFRDAARASGGSASSRSEAVRRLETKLGVRLLNRTTRSVAPTEAGARLLDRLGPALGEVEAALDAVNGFRDRPAGTLRLNVPIGAARLVLAAGCDAGIRYEERLEQDMIAIPIGPREQCFATAASPAYLDRRGRPDHPRDLLGHACLRGRFASGATPAWEFERDGEVVKVDPAGPLIVRVGAAIDLAVDAAVAGSGVIQLFEDWLRPYLDSGALEPVLEPWWQRFSGPFLYYPGRRHLPAPLRAFVDFTSSLGQRPVPGVGLFSA